MGIRHIIGTTDREGDKTAVTYHASGKIASVTNAGGKTFSFIYTPQDQIFVNPVIPSEQVTFTFPTLTQGTILTGRTSK